MAGFLLFVYEEQLFVDTTYAGLYQLDILAGQYLIYENKTVVNNITGMPNRFYAGTNGTWCRPMEDMVHLFRKRIPPVGALTFQIRNCGSTVCSKSYGFVHLTTGSLLGCGFTELSVAKSDDG